MAACVSGAVASSLSYEQIISGDQFGFLIGKIIVNVKDTVSDSQINATKVETYVHISSHLPCSHTNRFYDRRGKIIPESLKAILKDKQKEIVGWYRFRRNSTLQVSLLENAVHKNLVQFLDITQPENFVFLLTTASTSYNMATHSYDHVLYKFSHSSNEFLPISLSVINLGDTTHSQYKPYGTANNLQTGIYQTVVQKFENRFHDERGDIREVGLVKELSANLLTQLEKISSLVSDEEKQLERLEAEVEVYERKVNKLNKTSQSNSSFAPMNVHRLDAFIEGVDNDKKDCQRLTTNNHLITDFLKNDDSKRKLQMEVILKNFDAKDWLCKQANEDFNLSSHSANPIRADTQNTDTILNKLSAPVQASIQNFPHYNTISGPSNKISMRSMTNSYNNTSTMLRNTTEHTSLKSHSLKHSLNGDELNQEPNYVILPVGASLKSTQNYPKMNKPDDNSSSVMCNYSKATRCSLPKCKPHNCREEHEIGSSNQHINDIQSFHKQTQPSDAATTEQDEIGPYLKLAVNNNTVSAPNIPTTKYSARSIQNQQTLATNFPQCPLPTDIPLTPTSNHQTSSLSLHSLPNNPKSKMMYVDMQNSAIHSNDSSNISRGQEESAGCGEN
ncbi:uncharacterized protein LOC115219264 [Octopus sinensis]|uniref:Uncharacterized protein LOC115219264 n=1 Tax=Octopus sinensis TaxID=2607531 RepID=A0A6P7T3B6_9MOLL|nr:uncharacterized protein LOC115219264 [Octopus sinensis]